MKFNKRFIKSLWFPAMLSATMLFVGCETTSETVRKDPKNYPSREIKGYSRETTSVGSGDNAVLPADSASDVVYEDNLVRLEKQYLSGAAVGQSIDYKIIVTAKRAVTNVKVDEFLPKSLTFKDSKPKASMNELGMPSWDMKALKAGKQEVINVSVTPTKEGKYEVCSVVTAEPLICLPLTVGMPKLTIAKTGAGWAELGQEVRWEVTVTNTGTAVAKDVVIRDALPKGFTATSPLTKNVGDLAPGKSASMVVTATSTQQGNFTNVAYAKHSSGAELSASSPVNVQHSKVEITKTGPQTGFIFVPETYTITVTNTGSTELSDVVVKDQLPDGTVVRGKVAHSGQVYDNPGKSGDKKFMPPVYDSNRKVYGYWGPGGNTLSDDTADQVEWKLASLAPGQSKSFTLAISASRPMTTTNKAVVTARGPSGEPTGDQAKVSTTITAAKAPLLSKSASAKTVWKAVPGVHTGISDSNDPVQIGQETTYTIIALNQSGYDTFKVQGQKVIVGEGLKVKSVSAGGKVNGNEVTFGSVQLKPGREVARTITVIGDKPGTTTTRLETTVPFRKTAVIDQESTTVY